MIRRTLPQRRAAETLDLRFWNQPFAVTVGFYADGKSRERMYGMALRAAAARAKEARKEADRLAVDAWNKRMLGFQVAQPTPGLDNGPQCPMLRSLIVPGFAC
jgi:hypothetical protein